MRPLLLGCIADDFTGATDLSSTLVRGGMATVQLTGLPDARALASLDADAIVIALKSRNLPAHEAVEQSLLALRWLQAQGGRQIFFKYCSTFDSTPRGNIGPVTEALLEALGAPIAVLCPALPVNHRTVYQGHLFVGDKLLNESGMETHPLTPMTDANLVRVLQAQSAGQVGLVDAAVVERGPQAIRQRLKTLSESCRLAIADALSDEHLRTLGSALADAPLITGGSGLALGLPDNFRAAGLLTGTTSDHLLHVRGDAAVLSGSCSVATNAQVQHWRRSRPAFCIAPLALARGDDVLGAAMTWRAAQSGPVLFYATASADAVLEAQLALGAQRASALVERAMGDLARLLFQAGTRYLVVAGGETSGAVVQALDIRALRIGPAIAPGVPWTASVGDDSLWLALKSGNFGTEDFFERALQHAGALA